MVKQIIVFLLAGTLIVSLTACRGTSKTTSDIPASIENTPDSAADAESSDFGEILIDYFAVTGGEDDRGLVRVLAEEIQEATGGDLFSIQTSADYPSDINTLIDYANTEQAEDARPELTSHVENLEGYDTIFVGYPNWWYDMPHSDV